MKRCSKCKELKLFDDFYKNKNCKDGFHFYCKECDRDRRAGYGNSASKHLIARYCMTIEDRDDMLKLQDYRCAICGTDDPGKRGWCIDHDHSCCPGRNSCGYCIRMILCTPCNKGLGDFKDNPAILLKAVEYLCVGKIS